MPRQIFHIDVIVIVQTSNYKSYWQQILFITKCIISNGIDAECVLNAINNYLNELINKIDFAVVWCEFVCVCVCAGMQ